MIFSKYLFGCSELAIDWNSMNGDLFYTKACDSKIFKSNSSSNSQVKKLQVYGSDE